MIRRNSLFRALILFVPLVAATAWAQEQIQEPVFMRGDFWKYRVIRKPSGGGSLITKFYILRYAEGATQVAEIVDGKEVPRSETILQLLGFQQSERTQLLQFPLYIGKQWRDSRKVQRATIILNVEVVAVERVATQAGTFQSFKIESTQQYSVASPNAAGIGTVRADGSYFDSPETKSIVKYDGDILNGSSTF